MWFKWSALDHLLLFVCGIFSIHLGVMGSSVEEHFKTAVHAGMQLLGTPDIATCHDHCLSRFTSLFEFLLRDKHVAVHQRRVRTFLFIFYFTRIHSIGYLQRSLWRNPQFPRSCSRRNWKKASNSSISSWSCTRYTCLSTQLWNQLFGWFSISRWADEFTSKHM